MSAEKLSSQQSTPTVKRRGFLAATLATIGAVAAAPFATRARPANAATRETMRFARYPRPTFVPLDFYLSHEDYARSDGFALRRSRQLDELALIYKWKHQTRQVHGPNAALVVFVTRASNQTFRGTEGVEGEPVRLSFADGAVVGKYFDGSWVPAPLPRNGSPRKPSDPITVWGRDTWHSLVFEHAGFTFGIQGPIKAGVDRETLVRIALSTSVPQTVVAAAESTR